MLFIVLNYIPALECYYSSIHGTRFSILIGTITSPTLYIIKCYIGDNFALFIIFYGFCTKHCRHYRNWMSWLAHKICVNVWKYTWMFSSTQVWAKTIYIFSTTEFQTCIHVYLKDIQWTSTLKLFSSLNTILFFLLLLEDTLKWCHTKYDVRITICSCVTFFEWENVCQIITKSCKKVIGQ